MDYNKFWKEYAKSKCDINEDYYPKEPKVLDQEVLDYVDQFEHRLFSSFEDGIAFYIIKTHTN